jgi:hypothetical protein
MPKKTLITVGVIVLVLVGFRLALPHLLVRHINNTIRDLPDYEGRVDSMDLALIAGRVTVKDIELVERGSGLGIPFSYIPVVNASLDWEALWDGHFVAEVVIHSPRVNLVAAVEEADEQVEIAEEWLEIAERLMPVRIDKFRITDGEVRYLDTTKEPEIDILLTALNVDVRNLANTEGLQEEEFARLEVSTMVMHTGAFRMSGVVDPLSVSPRYAFDAELEHLDMTTFNNFLKAYGNFTVEQGWFAFYLEVAVDEGEFNGYVRPFMEDVQVLEGDEIEEGLLQFLWEALLEGVRAILESPGEEDVIAARIPFSGELDDPEVGVWESIVSLLRNAFIEALGRGLEFSVGMEDVPLPE